MPFYRQLALAGRDVEQAEVAVSLEEVARALEAGILSGTVNR